MIARLVAAAAGPAGRAFAAKLARVFVVSFVAASGTIWAKRLHKDDQKPRRTWSQLRRRP